MSTPAVSKDSNERMATGEEIETLCDSIGGFHYWPILCLHCKEKIIKFLDHTTRINLQQCSKTDYQLENSIPIGIYKIQIIENRHQWANKIFQIHVRIQFSKYNYNEKLEKQFSGNKLEEAVKFGEKWMKKCRFKFEELNVEMLDYPTHLSEIKSLPKCQNVRIRCGSDQMFRWWLQKTPEFLENLQLISPKTRDFEFSEEFLNHVHIKNAQKLYIMGNCEMTDEQFLSLKAKNMELEPTILSEKAINEYLKNWTLGQKPIHCVVLSFKSIPNQEKVLENLKIRQWDEAFERERFLCCSKFREFWGSGPTFQVWSEGKTDESLIVCFIQTEIIIQLCTF